MPGIVNNQVGAQDPTDPNALTTGAAKTTDPTAPVTGTTATPADSSTISTSTATGYNPTNVNVTDQQTVAGQVSKDLAAGSPIVDKARADAMDQANSRGLLNSSIAAGAGESAAIGSVIPIASQDANTFAAAATRNANSADTAGQFNAGAQNTASQVNTGIISQQQLTKLSGDVQTQLQTLKGTQSVDLANIESNYKQLLQTSASASSVYNESIGQIATILRDPNTSTAQKQSAIDGVNQLLKSSLDSIGKIGNVDLGTLLDFSATPA